LRLDNVDDPELERNDTMTKSLRHVNGILAAILLFVMFGYFTLRNWSLLSIYMIIVIPLVLSWCALVPTSSKTLRWAALLSQAIVAIAGLYVITDVFGSSAGMLRRGAQEDAVVGSLALLLAALNGTALKNALQLKPNTE
jgi:hypothetical protein